MKARIYNFNLIEIVLTVAVISFGVVVILGMLPKGLRATRNVAMVSHASEVIDQLGGYFQLNGAGIVTETEFAEKDPGASNADDADSKVMQDYKKLVPYIYKPGELPKKTNAAMPNDLGDDYIPTGIAGVFRYADEDIYIIVMGDSREVDGEQEVNTDFSGLLQVCKSADVEGNVILINHAASTHNCFTDDEQNCGVNPADFKLEKKTLPQVSRVYMELSYPLSLPYSQRTKKYYSFDVKK